MFGLVILSRQLKGASMSDRMFAVGVNTEIAESVVDAVFDFMDERTEAGDNPSHVIMAMLCVIQMIQEASDDSHFVH